MYLSTTKHKIMFVANLLSRFMHSQSQVHLGATKRVLRYIKVQLTKVCVFLKMKVETSKDITTRTKSDFATQGLRQYNLNLPLKYITMVSTMVLKNHHFVFKIYDMIFLR